MANVNRYVLCKNNNNKELVYLNYNLSEGFKFKPKNKVKYNGVKVNEMVIINPSFVEKVLKRKIKHKLDLYLQFLIKLLEEDNTDPTNLRHALNDLERYRRTIINKYRAYLDKKYVDLLLKKIDVLEREIKEKLFLCMQKEIQPEEELQETRRRGR